MSSTNKQNKKFVVKIGNRLEDAPRIAQILLGAAAVLLVTGSSYAGLFLLFGSSPPSQSTDGNATTTEVSKTLHRSHS